MMPDRETVIKCLEACTSSDECAGHSCPLFDFDDSVVSHGCRIQMELDALELLKEQEAVEPITEHHLFLCPVCKNTLFREQKFCHECGKRIEWEGR